MSFHSKTDSYDEERVISPKIRIPVQTFKSLLVMRASFVPYPYTHDENAREKRLRSLGSMVIR